MAEIPPEKRVQPAAGRPTGQPGSPGPGQQNGVLAGLPAAVFALVPELHQLARTGESRADCARCVLLPDNLGAADHPWAFHPHTRCCTYHPELPNYLAGQALERGGTGADRLRERMADRTGLSAWGVRPSDSFMAARTATILGFGRDPAMRCPFYVGGQYTCGIWHDRNAICRTWFCRHDDGVVSLTRWTALRKPLSLVEMLLARWCMDQGQPPVLPDGSEPVDIAAWESWFVWCAHQVAALGADNLRDLATTELASLRRRLVSCMDLPDRHLPEVVVPVLRGAQVTGRGFGLEGYSSYDGIEVDPDIIHFFARLDGKRTWRQARDLAAAERGVAIADELVRELRRIDVLQSPARVFEFASEHRLALPPDADRDVPDILTPSAQKPLVVDNEVWIQGQVPLASVIVPRSIFWFLSRLDGHTPWQSIVAAMQDEHDRPIDSSVVTALYRIGALHPPD